jgi:hypothetical protein
MRFSRCKCADRNIIGDLEPQCEFQDEMLLSYMLRPERFLASARIDLCAPEAERLA